MVSQVIEGAAKAHFYVSTLRSNMGGVRPHPPPRQSSAKSGYKKFQQINRGRRVWLIHSFRFNPDLSNPPRSRKSGDGLLHPKA